MPDLSTIAPQPISDEIIIQNIRTGLRIIIDRDMAVAREARLEDYLVAHLIDFDPVDYDANADLLYKLAGQMVGWLRSYLPDDDAVENVLLHQGKMLAAFIFRQMMRHYRETPTRYQAKVTRGFQLLTPLTFKVADPTSIRDFRAPVVPPSDTRRFIYSGFSRCAFPQQSFQSDEERRFAVLIDSAHEAEVIRWVKPGPKQFPIEYRRAEKHEPDFFVETVSEKFIVEVKARKDREDETVKAKARAARISVGHANTHAQSYGGKPWRYLMIPHDAIFENSTLAGLLAKFAQGAELVDADGVLLSPG